MSKIEDGGPDDENEYDTVTCPKCDGVGSVDCHCGGDLCVCENYGEIPCPMCGDAGEIARVDYDAWVKRAAEQQRLFAAAMIKVWGDK